MSMQQSHAQLSEELTAALSLNHPPVAISFTGDLSIAVSTPASPVAAGCRFWQDAATATFATVAADHYHCAIGVHTHNLEPAPSQQADLMDALKVFGDLGYVRPEDLPLIPVRASRSKYVVYGPLAQVTAAPDVVLFFVNSNQTLVLSEAVQQIEAGNPPAMGRPACAVVPQVINTGRAALSLGCCGARAYLDVLTDDVALLALPGARIHAYAERIVALAGANEVLSRFHQMRRRDVDRGEMLTIQESLEVFMAS